ncbi:protein artichoke-like [Lytechinus variegatus]|uniref:protein artichoke-like n=1 Tax=Lytechinus variegatus TaxID=7654 RepID=UPI001BB13D98|nr:protein artichoke-like [Lytechinus variegatus]
MGVWYLLRFEGLCPIFVGFFLVTSAYPMHSVNDSICLQTCNCVKKRMDTVFCDALYLSAIPAVDRFPPMVKTLFLSQNLLTIIENDAFYLLTLLTSLRLGDNFISTIEPRAFSGLVNLLLLQLTENSLVDLFALPSVPSLTIDFNFIQHANGYYQPISAEFNSPSDFRIISLSNNFLFGLSNLTLPVSRIVACESKLQIFDIHEIKFPHRVNSIDVRRNNIRLLPDLTNLSRLKIICLLENPIHVIQSLQWPKSIRTLQIHSDRANWTIPFDNTSSQITQLTLSGAGISSVNDVLCWDVNFFEILDITKSSVGDVIDFPQIPNLDELRITHSKLRDITILNPCLFPTLKVVDFRFNQITKFTILNGINDRCVIASASIRKLNLENNQINDTDFLKNLTTLIELYLSYNNIWTVDWTSLTTNTELHIFRISDNYIYSIQNLINLDKLTILDVSQNRIMFIEPGTFDDCSDLNTLKLSHNKLTEFPELTEFSKPSFTLDLRYNDIERVTLVGVDLDATLSIDIGWNKIRYFEGSAHEDRARGIFLRNNLLESLQEVNVSLIESIYILDLGHNLLTNLNHPDFIAKKFIRYTVDHNRLYHIPLPARTKILNCSHNSINHLHEDRNCATGDVDCKTVCELTVLDAGWNKITALQENAFRNCSRLNEVFLQGNPLQSVSSDFLRSLHSFSLSHSLLRSADIEIERYDLVTGTIEMNNVTLFRQQPNVSFNFSLPFLTKSLLLCCNEMSMLPSINAPLIEHLDLSRNEIHSISRNTFAKMSRVSSIDLQDNLIESIPEHAFTSCSRLSEINLEHNRIEFISRSAFPNSGKSLAIRLGWNRLMTIQPSSFPLLSSTIYLDANPWHCDCKLKNLQRWLHQSGVHAVNCATPRYRNQNLLHLQLDSCPNPTPGVEALEPSPSFASRGFLIKETEYFAFVSFHFIVLYSWNL